MGHRWSMAPTDVRYFFAGKLARLCPGRPDFTVAAQPAKCRVGRERDRVSPIASGADGGGRGFAVLSVVLASTTVGWWRRRRWAWFMALGILVVNLVSDVLRTVMTQQWSGASGLFVEGLIVIWISSRPVRLHYVPRTHTTDDA